VIVKEILDRLGGKIQVKSRLGEGTSFTCLIPGISKS
jgi:signal transduction histidine kinase